MYNSLEEIREIKSHSNIFYEVHFFRFFNIFLYIEISHSRIFNRDVGKILILSISKFDLQLNTSVPFRKFL